MHGRLISELKALLVTAGPSGVSILCCFQGYVVERRQLLLFLLSCSHSGGAPVRGLALCKRLPLHLLPCKQANFFSAPKTLPLSYVPHARVPHAPLGWPAKSQDKALPLACPSSLSSKFIADLVGKKT